MPKRYSATFICESCGVSGPSSTQAYDTVQDVLNDLMNISENHALKNISLVTVEKKEFVSRIYDPFNGILFTSPKMPTYPAALKAAGDFLSSKANVIFGNCRVIVTQAD